MHQHDQCLKSSWVGRLMLPMVVFVAEVGVAVIAGGLVSAIAVLVVQGFFDALFKMLDTATCCSVDDVPLYDLIPSVLR